MPAELGGLMGSVRRAMGWWYPGWGRAFSLCPENWPGAEPCELGTKQL